jgi:anti-sigma B factor antagonist/stage II sporulation protein AA (anti-sigma F factor antagonist)
MSDLASFTAEREDDVVVGVLSGEVDLSNATVLERSIAEAVPNDVRGLVLDLSALSYIDSSGIRLILSLAGSLRWRGQDLVLAVPEGSTCRRILSLAGIGGSVRLEATADGARARFRANGTGPSPR